MEGQIVATATCSCGTHLQWVVGQEQGGPEGHYLTVHAEEWKGNATLRSAVLSMTAQCEAMARDRHAL